MGRMSGVPHFTTLVHTYIWHSVLHAFYLDCLLRVVGITVKQTKKAPINARANPTTVRLRRSSFGAIMLEEGSTFIALKYSGLMLQDVSRSCSL